MNLQEYRQVENLTYLEYCDYLQRKYGLAKYNYMSENWKKNPKVTRTKEGLYVHHKYEDYAIMLGTSKFAMRNPYEWQLKENLVYCDLLEHLFLHQLICEYPAENKNENEQVGMGGVVNFIVPELNDVYSGWVSRLPWQQNCHQAIIGNKDVYLALLKRYKDFHDNNPFVVKWLLKSYNEEYGLWSNKKNAALYKEIMNL